MTRTHRLDRECCGSRVFYEDGRCWYCGNQPEEIMIPLMICVEERVCERCGDTFQLLRTRFDGKPLWCKGCVVTFDVA